MEVIFAGASISHRLLPIADFDHIYSIYMNVAPGLRPHLLDNTIKICYNNKKTLLQEKGKFWRQPLYNEYRKKYLNFHGILMIIAGPL